MATSNDTREFNSGLLSFLEQSPTPFHAVAMLQTALKNAGFLELNEQDAWTLQAEGRYYLTRNDSSLIAFSVGAQPPVEKGVRIVGAHTDSPCLKVKPNADIHRHGYHQLGLEVYGGVLLNPWFDRDLSLAGRVSYRQKNGSVINRLLNFKRPMGSIPSLAIHLDRDVNSQRSINSQTDLPMLLALGDAQESTSFRELLAAQIAVEHGDSDVEDVLAYEISLFDTQAPSVLGARDEFIASARLDNLLSCYAGLRALLAAEGSATKVLVCNDHEEVGSVSTAGANGPMLRDCLRRICGGDEDFVRSMQKSMLVSADNAHGIHPNFAEKHDSQHGPVLNKGVVIKINANQRYASNSVTEACFRECARQADTPLQSFVVRSDMACGSTIGPITAAELGVPTIDVGVPTFAMHSIREFAGSRDACDLATILETFYSRS